MTELKIFKIQNASWHSCDTTSNTFWFKQKKISVLKVHRFVYEHNKSNTWSSISLDTRKYYRLHEIMMLTNTDTDPLERTSRHYRSTYRVWWFLIHTLTEHEPTLRHKIATWKLQQRQSSSRTQRTRSWRESYQSDDRRWHTYHHRLAKTWNELLNELSKSTTNLRMLKI